MKYFAVVILLSLLFGLGATVGSAWLATLLSNDELFANESQLELEQSETWELSTYRRLGVWAGMAIFISYKSTEAVHISDVTIPKWSRLRNLPEYMGGDPKPMMCDYGYGWPFISMWKSFDAARDWQTGTIISQEITGTLGNLNLPAKIIVRGFVGDVIFFAMLFLLCLIVVKRTRKRWRVLKGNCPICCYNLRSDLTSGCPECGWQRDECDSDEDQSPAA